MLVRAFIEKLFVKIDKNQSGKIEKTETINWIRELEENYIKRDSIEEFKAFDSNGDRFITFEGKNLMTLTLTRSPSTIDVRLGPNNSLSSNQNFQKFKNLTKYQMMIRTQSTEKQFTNSACVIKTKIQGYQNPYNFSYS